MMLFVKWWDSFYWAAVYPVNIYCMHYCMAALYSAGDWILSLYSSGLCSRGVYGHIDKYVVIQMCQDTKCTEERLRGTQTYSSHDEGDPCVNLKEVGII